jgi:hypothetical protein
MHHTPAWELPKVKSRPVMILLATLIGVPALANAAPAAIRYTGTVTAVYSGAGLSPLSATLGSTFTADVVLADPSTAPVDVSPSADVEQFFDVVQSVTVSVGGSSFTFAPGTGGQVNQMYVENDRSFGTGTLRDIWDVSAKNAADIPSSPGVQFWMLALLRGSGLVAPDGITSPGYQVLPANIAGFNDSKTFGFYATALNASGSVVQDGFAGLISSVTPVPVPAAAWLLLSGIAAVGALARKRRVAESIA